MFRKKTKVGDRIATVKDGWVKVTKISLSNTGRKIHTSTKRSYNSQGKENDSDAAPSAFDDPPQWLLDYIGPLIKDGDRVMAWRSGEKGNPRSICKEPVKRCIYKEPIKGGGHLCYVDGKNEWTSNGETEKWDYVELVEEED